MIAKRHVVGVPAEGAILRPMPATAHDLALRYLLELSADIRAALLMDRDGALLAAVGSLPSGGLPERARRVVAEVESLGQAGVSGGVDLLATRGARLLVARGARGMVFKNNPTQNPSVI